MVEHLSGRVSMRQRMESARKWASTTPGRLRVFSLEIAIVVVALIAIGTGTVTTALVTVTGIQGRTVPMIVEMQHIHAWLSDADRSASSAYLANRFDSGITQAQFEAEATATGLDLLGRLNPDDPQVRYEADIAAVNRELQHATEQTQEGDDANVRLHTLAVSIANYTRQIDTAAATKSGDATAANVYLEGGSNLMHAPGGILDQVDTLRGLYAADLRRANVTLQVTAGMAVLYVGVAVWLLVLLVRTQRFVTARFRRRRNSRLMAATTLLVVVLVGSGIGAVQATQAIRTAENECLAQVMDLWDTRTLAYDANTDANMAIIQPGSSSTHTQSFRSETGRLDSLLAGEQQAAVAGSELESASHAMQAYRDFIQATSAATQLADANARAADAARNRSNAVRPSASASPSPSPAASPSPSPAAAPAPVTDQAMVASVDQLDWYIGASLQIREGQFDAAINSAAVMLYFTLALVVAAVVIAALTFWGLKPRIDEYAV